MTTLAYRLCLRPGWFPPTGTLGLLICRLQVFPKVQSPSSNAVTIPVFGAVLLALTVHGLPLNHGPPTGLAGAVMTHLFELALIHWNCSFTVTPPFGPSVTAPVDMFTCGIVGTAAGLLM